MTLLANVLADLPSYLVLIRKGPHSGIVYVIVGKKQLYIVLIYDADLLKAVVVIGKIICQKQNYKI